MVSFWKSSLLDNVLRSSLDLSSLLHSILGKKDYETCKNSSKNKKYFSYITADAENYTNYRFREY